MALFKMIFTGTVRALFSAIELCFLLRAILSLFPIKEDNPFLNFTCMVTEPIIHPIRLLFEKMGWFEDSPIDVAFLAAILLVNLVGSLVLVL